MSRWTVFLEQGSREPGAALPVEWTDRGPLILGWPAAEPPAGVPVSLAFPGFVDLHIHGAFGIDFMSATSDQMIELAERLCGIGYDAFLPTTITAPAEAVLRAIRSLPEHAAIPGFHLEGPFISPEYPGAQPREFILDPPVGPSEWDEVFDHPKLKRITLAPERPGALALIERLADRGVQVSMGHTAATYEEAAAGFRAGVTGATHTYNAMRGLHHREPGALGAVLSHHEVVPELIYDRVHVSPPSAGILLNSPIGKPRTAPMRRVAAVSDCTMAAGLPPGTELDMWGIKVLTAEGEVRLKENGALAGSAATLADCFQRLSEDFHPLLAIQACSIIPREVLDPGRPVGTWLELDPKSKALSVHRTRQG